MGLMASADEEGMDETWQNSRKEWIALPGHRRKTGASVYPRKRGGLPKLPNTDYGSECLRRDLLRRPVPVSGYDRRGRTFLGGRPASHLFGSFLETL